ncbi:MAG: DNA-binding response regulator [Hyphomicrobiales bacterium]|nr:MAG: DNA-binding response regulator [Hyphomicrobiales bacterium]
MSILIVEDDSDTQQEMLRAAHDLGVDAVATSTLDEGRLALAASEPRLIILDRMLPGGDGLDFIKELNSKAPTALILVVSALGRSANRIEGLERGADDYLAKPFDPDELRARMRALLRRFEKPTDPADLMSFGALEIREKSRTVHFGDAHIPLSPKEFELLLYFAVNADQLVTRAMLLKDVWNFHFDPQTNVVDVHIGRLRKKLEQETDLAFLRTVRGKGYVFAVPEHSSDGKQDG